jgi:hypothetical protein
VSEKKIPFKGKSQSLSSQQKGRKSLVQRNPAHMTRAIVIGTFFRGEFLHWALFTINSCP